MVAHWSATYQFFWEEKTFSHYYLLVRVKKKKESIFKVKASSAKKLQKPLFDWSEETTKQAKSRITDKTELRVTLEDAQAKKELGESPRITKWNLLWRCPSFLWSKENRASEREKERGEEKEKKGEEKERETERREKIYGASPAFFLAKRKPEG